MEFYLNGNFCDKPNVININDRGFLLGDGIFTTILVVQAKIIDLSAHFNRLVTHAKLIDLSFQLNLKQLQEICNNLLKINNLCTVPQALIRVSITRGNNLTRGLDIINYTIPTILIQSFNYKNNSTAINLAFVDIYRSKKSILTGIKSLNCLELILARKRAIDRGFDDGIILNEQENITETAAANIFFIDCADQIFTPPLKDGVLAGIVRAKTLKIIKNLKLNYQEKSISMCTINNYKAGFITNSAIGIKTIKTIENIVFDCDVEIIKKINELYVELMFLKK